MFEKKELRTRMKAIRKECRSTERDERITKLVLENFDFESYFVYLSFGSEAGTAKLIEELRRRNRQICVPLVLGKEMLSVPLSDKLKAGAFGILEPEGGEETTCAAAIVPMLAFDEAGFRLGYGGGYYDRYFALHPEVFRLGIAYEGQLTREHFSEPFDRRLDALVTEAAIRRFDRAEETPCG